MTLESKDAGHCPLCSGINRCSMTGGGGGEIERCWCWREKVPAALLARLPEADRGKACICQHCVKAFKAEFYNADS